MTGQEPEEAYTIRQRRVAELVAQEISLVLQQRAQDPRLSSVVVTAVRISRDLRLATVYFGTAVPEERMTALEALQHCTSFIRRELAGRLPLRFVPELRFRLDDTYDRAQRIERLLAEVKGEPPGKDVDSAAPHAQGAGDNAQAS